MEMMWPEWQSQHRHHTGQGTVERVGVAAAAGFLVASHLAVVEWHSKLAGGELLPHCAFGQPV